MSDRVFHHSLHHQIVANRVKEMSGEVAKCIAAFFISREIYNSAKGNPFSKRMLDVAAERIVSDFDVLPESVLDVVPSFDITEES